MTVRNYVLLFFFPLLTFAQVNTHLWSNLPYKLFLPSKWSPNRELIVAIHGCKMNADDMAGVTEFNKYAEREGFAVLYPQQRDGAHPDQCWNWYEPWNQYRNSGEIGEIAKLAEKVIREHAIRRVYGVGISSGAGALIHLSFCHRELFDAIGIHSGFQFRGASSVPEALFLLEKGSLKSAELSGREAYFCTPSQQRRKGILPVIVIHGRLDTRLHPINADQLFEQILVTEDLLDDGKRNYSFSVDEEKRTDQQDSNSYLYDTIAIGPHIKGSMRRAVEQLLIQNLGHAWSGGPLGLKFSDPKGPKASRYMLDFFRGKKKLFLLRKRQIYNLESLIAYRILIEMNRWIVKASAFSLSLGLVACSDERYPVKIETFPIKPVVVDQGFKIATKIDSAGDIVYKEYSSNWFRTKLKVSNLGTSPLQILSVTFYILGGKKEDAESGDTTTDKSAKEQDASQAVATCEKQVAGSTQQIPPGEYKELLSFDDVAEDSQFMDEEGELDGTFFYCAGLGGFGSNYARNVKVVLNGWQGDYTKADARLLAFDFFETQ